MRFVRFGLVSAILFCMSFSLHADIFAGIDSLVNPLYKYVEILPEYHMEADLSGFALHKDAFYRHRYFFEANMNLEFDFFAIQKLVYSVWEFGLLTGAGQVPGNDAFSLLDIDYTIIPALEVRTKNLNAQLGIEHRCFHEIDRTEFDLVHWNKMYLGLSSSNARTAEYWKGIGQTSISLAERISWKVRVGGFIYSWFGLLQDQFLARDNWRQNEVDADLRYTFYTRSSWAVNARTKTVVGYWREPEKTGYVYWRQDLILESNLTRGKQGMLFFVDYIFDDMPLYNGVPRFNKDRLLQFGVRFFY